MKKRSKKYFTIPEITISIAILSMGLLSLLATFAPAFRMGHQAVQVTTNSIKLRSVASLYSHYGVDNTNITSVLKGKEIKAGFAGSESGWLDDGSDAMDISVNHKVYIPDLLKVNGIDMKDEFGNLIPGVLPITNFCNGKFKIDRVCLQINDEVNTIIYTIR